MYAAPLGRGLSIYPSFVVLFARQKSNILCIKFSTRCTEIFYNKSLHLRLFMSLPDHPQNMYCKLFKFLQSPCMQTMWLTTGRWLMEFSFIRQPGLDLHMQLLQMDGVNPIPYISLYNFEVYHDCEAIYISL